MLEGNFINNVGLEVVVLSLEARSRAGPIGDSLELEKDIILHSANAKKENQLLSLQIHPTQGIQFEVA